eukprot:TRINITY_DN16975_c0_g1_i2.p1 TRINITY_DN16975_c0_g1~~TRINITY_DN16975_c0_g1_i2.p1  ORF type:complete len:128 (+),score=43.94 TRINITY_DN16975_c0_g1_i2:494-877(+)
MVVQDLDKIMAEEEVEEENDEEEEGEDVLEHDQEPGIAEQKEDSLFSSSEINKAKTGGSISRWNSKRKEKRAARKKDRAPKVRKHRLKRAFKKKIDALEKTATLIGAVVAVTTVILTNRKVSCFEAK